MKDSELLMIKLYRQCKAYGNFIANQTSFDKRNNSLPVCPVIFDGYLCWGPTEADTTSTQNCPKYVIGYDENLIASKVCLANGSWWKHPENGREWSNYTQCINHVYLEVISQINSSLLTRHN